MPRWVREYCCWSCASTTCSLSAWQCIRSQNNQIFRIRIQLRQVKAATEDEWMDEYSEVNSLMRQVTKENTSWQRGSTRSTSLVCFNKWSDKTEFFSRGSHIVMMMMMMTSVQCFRRYRVVSSKCKIKRDGGWTVVCCFFVPVCPRSLHTPWPLCWGCSCLCHWARAWLRVWRRAARLQLRSLNSLRWLTPLYPSASKPEQTHSAVGLHLHTLTHTAANQREQTYFKGVWRCHRGPAASRAAHVHKRDRVTYSRTWRGPVGVATHHKPQRPP